MVTARRTLVTEEEFLAMPVSLDKIELIDGEILVSPAPTVGHQWLQGEFFGELRAWSRACTEPFTVLGAPSDVRFGKGRILQPDVYVLRGQLRLDVKGPVTAVPLLCVEMRSGGLYDAVTKRVLYADAGVAEYWVVERSGLVVRWTGEKLHVGEEVAAVLTSSNLPGFSLDVARVMAELKARSGE